MDRNTKTRSFFCMAVFLALSIFLLIKCLTPTIYENKNTYNNQKSTQVTEHLPSEDFNKTKNSKLFFSINKENNNAQSLTRSHEIEDIEIDGAVNVDFDSQLIFDHDLRDLLDFYIGLTVHSGELSNLKVGLENYLNENQFSENLIEGVINVLDNYLNYREAAVELEAVNFNDSSMIELFDKLYDLRRIHLGSEVADGFFAVEEASNRYIIERQRVLSNVALNEEEKQLELALLQQQLPSEVRITRNNAVRIAVAKKEVEILKEKGATSIEIYQSRVKNLGPEAAQRLLVLNEQQEIWRDKFEAYSLEKKRLSEKDNLGAKELILAIENLRDQYFTQTEKLRVNALEQQLF